MSSVLHLTWRAELIVCAYCSLLCLGILPIFSPIFLNNEGICTCPHFPPFSADWPQGHYRYSSSSRARRNPHMSTLPSLAPLLQIGPKLLKFVPGQKAADLKQWLTI